MIKICDCTWCKHRGEKKGYTMTCEAFPDGIPYSFDIDNASTFGECNNGIKFEPVEK